MLDIKFIRENKEEVKKATQDKGIDVSIEELLRLDEDRRRLLTETQKYNQAKNSASREIPKLGKEERGKKIAEMKEIDGKAGKTSADLKKVSQKFVELMLLVPNIPSVNTPIGVDEKSNKELYTWGKIKKLDFPIKSHIALGKDLNLLDLQRGVKVSGFRGYFLKNEAVLMHFGIMQLALSKLIKKGFTPLLPPTLVKHEVLTGSGHFPFGKEEIYQIGNPHSFSDNAKAGEGGKEPLYLAGTSEPALLSFYGNEVLNEADLPIKLCGISQCYRSEVGSYGKDTKGIYRIHEFMKVEQVVFSAASDEESLKLLLELEEVSTDILKELELPFRVIINSTGDQGAGKFEMHDIETWMPARNAYGETHSNSALGDWQARRLNIRYKAKDGSLKFVHTLNNTAIASPRILIAIWENYQQKDGSIEVPKSLQKYVGKKIIIPAKS